MIHELKKTSSEFHSVSYNSHSLILGAVIFVRWLLKRIRSIVSSQLSWQRDEHFSQRRMNVEEESSVDVPTAHFSEMSFIPAKNLSTS